MEETFQKIYDQYHQDLFQFLFYMVKDKNQAEDLVQEVYIRVLHSYETFEGRSSEKTWLLSISKEARFFRCFCLQMFHKNAGRGCILPELSLLPGFCLLPYKIKTEINPDDTDHIFSERFLPPETPPFNLLSFVNLKRLHYNYYNYITNI